MKSLEPLPSSRFGVELLDNAAEVGLLALIDQATTPVASSSRRSVEQPKTRAVSAMITAATAMFSRPSVTEAMIVEWKVILGPSNPNLESILT